MSKSSLLALPDELLCTIMSLAQIPPCEVTVAKKHSGFPLLQVNRRLRHVAFDLFTRTHVVLSLRSLKANYSASIPDNPIDKFIENASLHLVEIPSHWRSLHPYHPAILRLDIDLGTSLGEFAYLLDKRERDFICTTHGLVFLLRQYHESEYSQLSISYSIAHWSAQCRLFNSILDAFHLPFDVLSSTGESSALQAVNLASKAPCEQYSWELARPLLQGQADEFVVTVKHILKLVKSCILSKDFESAVSIVLYLGLPLLNQLSHVAPRWLWIHASRSVFPQLAWPNWRTNARLALMFEITRLSTQLLCCAYVAYCISIEEGTHIWAQAHPMIMEQHYLIENFGMSAKEIADFDFVVVLQWLYECKAKEYTAESRELSTQLLKQLRDAYQAGGCQPIHADVYARVAVSVGLEEKNASSRQVLGIRAD